MFLEIDLSIINGVTEQYEWDHVEESGPLIRIEDDQDAGQQAHDEGGPRYNWIPRRFEFQFVLRMTILEKAFAKIDF